MAAHRLSSLVASCIVMMAMSVRVDVKKIASDVNNASSHAQGNPVKLTIQECVTASLTHGSYTALIEQVLSSPDKASADCSLLASGPCSLVGGGPPYFYPQRDLGSDEIRAAIMGEGGSVDARLEFSPDDGYNPTVHDCAKCPAPFSPLAHSCMDKDYADGGWADPEDKALIKNSAPEWMESSCQNEKLKWSFPDRQAMSWCSGQVQMIDGYLKNPAGRTGITGRGSLGLWGPNKAGDPIIVADGATLNSIILQDSELLVNDYGNQPFDPAEKYVRLIKRTDVDAVAIPGGMIDPGESGLSAAIREMSEETMAVPEGVVGFVPVSNAELEAFLKPLSTLVYRGLVDDPRNTDDAWMETEAYKIDISGSDRAGSWQQRIRTKIITGRAGDDAGAVRWLSLSAAGTTGKLNWKQQSEVEGKELECCYASHYALIKLAYASE